MESNAAIDYMETAFLKRAASDTRFTGFVVSDEWLYPEIRKGDVVLVDTFERLEGTGIFAIEGPFGKEVVRLQRKAMGGYSSIIDYPDRESVEHTGEPKVLGKVVMVFRKVV